MARLFFMNDYNCGCAPEILARLTKENLTPHVGYGSDEITKEAAQKILDAAGVPEGGVYFAAGGTQANSIVISHFLKTYQGVICAQTGHINCHEAGAIEAMGHKVLTLPEKDKVSAAALETYLKAFYEDESYTAMVQPGMVYISNPTEVGTLYNKEELTDISAACYELGLYLFVDGARMAYGLTSPANDLSLQDYAALCDVFYLGGTKCGALFGEAVVFTKGNTPKHFLTQIKQHGALLAKGWLLGLQFGTLFTDDLYLRIAANANRQADRIREALRERGYTLTFEAPTNQVFVTLDHPTIERLQAHVRMGFMEKADNEHTVMRLCTSWATTDEQVDQLIALL